MLTQQKNQKLIINVERVSSIAMAGSYYRNLAQLSAFLQKMKADSWRNQTFIYIIIDAYHQIGEKLLIIILAL